MARQRGKESEEKETAGGRPVAVPESAGPLNALPELMRKALSIGFSSFFVTEEAFRKALGETLPKDWIDFVVEQSGRTRTDFVDRLGSEVGRTLENADLAAMLEQLLEGRTLEIKAEIRLGPKRGEPGGKAVEVEVSRARAKRRN
jgi:hypothetical protein